MPKLHQSPGANLARTSASSQKNFARVRDHTCRVTDVLYGRCQIAHLCPAKEDKWFKDNNMVTYTGNNWINSATNLIQLRADIHQCLYNFSLVFVPIQDPVNPCLAVFCLDTDETLVNEFHCMKLKPTVGIRVEFFFTRFALAMFSLLVSSPDELSESNELSSSNVSVANAPSATKSPMARRPKRKAHESNLESLNEQELSSRKTKTSAAQDFQQYAREMLLWERARSDTGGRFENQLSWVRESLDGSRPLRSSTAISTLYQIISGDELLPLQMDFPGPEEFASENWVAYQENWGPSPSFSRKQDSSMSKH
ncbi:MAG: hypothetical protein M1829_001168 [Trizodia sp. TS-e1964]|nr:MAG: hypothetical protein M1829_001168 [Trizodia sp. TS-e1964]